MHWNTNNPVTCCLLSEGSRDKGMGTNETRSQSTAKEMRLPRTAQHTLERRNPDVTHLKSPWSDLVPPKGRVDVESLHFLKRSLYAVQSSKE